MRIDSGWVCSTHGTSGTGLGGCLACQFAHVGRSVISDEISDEEWKIRIRNITPHLRFVSRNGRHILQQWWTAYDNHQGDFSNALSWKGEWRDVPSSTESEA